MKFYLIFILFTIAITYTPMLVQASVPVWVTNFDQCTEFQQRMESFEYSLHSTLLQKQLDTEASRELARVQKARFDVNRLIASVYDELRTTQVNLLEEGAKVLQKMGIAVIDPNQPYKSGLGVCKLSYGNNIGNDSQCVAAQQEARTESGSEFCKASYEIKVKIGNDDPQCVAVQQEARIITSIDDYIFEEPIRKAADFLFCYLGDWRHFPIDDINSDYNCEELTGSKECSEQDIISKLDSLGKDVNKKFIDNKIGIEEVCEAMRDKGKKCSADIMRDTIKYNTLNQISRKDRTFTLMPPQTWYTPDRCKIIESALPSCGSDSDNESQPSCSLNTPYTKNIKRLTKNNTDSIYGNPTLKLKPRNDPNWSFDKVLASIQVPENSVTGLQEKALNQAQKIINDYTELNKIQYQTGKGLRPATYIVGFKDYLDESSYKILMGDILGSPLPRWYENKYKIQDIQSPNGEYFFFDTGIVISPTVILLDKLQSAIQAQFDLARDTFAFIGSDGTNPDNYPRIEYNSETISGSGAGGVNASSIIQNNLSYNSDVNLGLTTTIGSNIVDIDAVSGLIKGAGLSTDKIQSVLKGNNIDSKKISDSVTELYNQKASPEVISIFTNIIGNGVSKNTISEAVTDLAVKKVPIDYIGSTVNGLSEGKIDTDTATNVYSKLINGNVSYKNIGNIMGELSNSGISINSIKTIGTEMENLGINLNSVSDITSFLSNKIIPSNTINNATNFLSSIGLNNVSTGIIKNALTGNSFNPNSIKNSLVEIGKENITIDNAKAFFRNFNKIDPITSGKVVEESIKSGIDSNIIDATISSLSNVPNSSVNQLISNLKGISSPDTIRTVTSLMAGELGSGSFAMPMVENFLSPSGVPPGVISIIKSLFPKRSSNGTSANKCQSFTEEWLKPGPLNINNLLLNPTIPEEELLPPPYYDQSITFNLDTGTPLQNRITEDIGDFEQNYFTQFYNNVFQLYKTPFNEILENWFKPFDNVNSNSIFK